MPRCRRRFARVAAAAGYHVLLARCAAEAYELLAGNEVGVVLAGEDLAGDSAIDFFRRIKHMHPRSVRVLLTGDTSAANLANAINRGAIFKFVPDALVRRLASRACSPAPSRITSTFNTSLSTLGIFVIDLRVDV